MKKSALFAVFAPESTIRNMELISTPFRDWKNAVGSQRGTLNKHANSLQAGSSVENGARSKYKGLASYQALIFQPRSISTEEPACRLTCKF